MLEVSDDLCELNSGHLPEFIFVDRDPAPLRLAGRRRKAGRFAFAHGYEGSAPSDATALLRLAAAQRTETPGDLPPAFDAGMIT